MPIIALRGRAPAVATMALALVIGGLCLSAGGQLGAGRRLVGRVGCEPVARATVSSTSAAPARCISWRLAWRWPRWWCGPRAVPNARLADAKLPPAHLPLLAVLGCLLIPSGAIGWMWANPLQTGLVNDLGLMRGSVNVLLFAAAGSIVPLLYTWFVTGKSDPVMTARGVAAGRRGRAGGRSVRVAGCGRAHRSAGRGHGTVCDLSSGHARCASTT